MADTREPETAQAGLTLAWVRPFGEYTGWTLIYVLRLPAADAITITATVSNGQFSVTVPPSVTSTWPTGSGQLLGFVESVDDRRQVYSGPLQVIANPLTDSTYDGRGTWTKICDALEAQLLGNATEAQLLIVESSFATYGVKMADMNGVTKFHNYARQLKEAEQELNRQQAGLPPRSDMRVVFS